MYGKYVRGMTTGLLIGTTVGMMVMPQLDRGTKRRMRKSYRQMRHFAEGAYNGMVNWMR